MEIRKMIELEIIGKMSKENLFFRKELDRRLLI
jgi:hypothetical protein